MTKYDAVARTVDAEQWNPLPAAPGCAPEQMPPANSDVVRLHTISRWPRRRMVWQVQTIHGDWVSIEPGDYLVLEPDGKHVYPCKAEIFEKHYVPHNPQGNAPHERD